MRTLTDSSHFFLTQRPNLRVSLMTYLNESQVPEGSQELEILFADDLFCEPVMIDRDHVGENCQVTWDRETGTRGRHRSGSMTAAHAFQEGTQGPRGRPEIKLPISQYSTSAWPVRD